MVHVTYRGSKVNGLTPPPPDLVTIDGEEEYKVNHIIDSKMFGRTLKYIVKTTRLRPDVGP